MVGGWWRAGLALLLLGLNTLICCSVLFALALLRLLLLLPGPDRDLGVGADGFDGGRFDGGGVAVGRIE